MDYFKQSKAKKLRRLAEEQSSSPALPLISHSAGSALTSGGFVALSPISPQELLMKPASNPTEDGEDFQVSMQADEQETDGLWEEEQPPERFYRPRHKSYKAAVSHSEHQAERERGRSKEQRHLLSPDASRFHSNERRSKSCSRSPSEERREGHTRQGNSSDSPVPSTSESSTPSTRRRLSQTPTHSHPHVSYSPLVCHPQPSLQVEDEEEEEQGGEGGAPILGCCSNALWDENVEEEVVQVGEVEEEEEEETGHDEEDEYLSSGPRRFPSEPFLAMQEEEHSPDSSAMETLTFEAAVATSLGRANTVTASMRTRARLGWHVPNGHFRKRLAQSMSISAGEPLSDTEDDKY
ncbi:Voltage-dependent R-type calcium channel subunit alpha-1E [Bagarius yarrelli]|uniref:Voltage-dependent R-type calcium channel subunit alpha-1E n=1 Tax=Bagarius yarrelli TaxID=175774 RepID=A0A556V1F3_BAGYA|nr:Voltage-dependent R-type calcium channel subunit alpha-1E [Bagarius yarrelli]